MKTKRDADGSRELVVRRANEDDWALMRAIRLEALLDTPDAFGTTFGDAAAYPDERWRSMASEGWHFLAERDGRVVGRATVDTNDDHPDTHWLYGMYVSPSARGTGVADALVEAVSERVRSLGGTALYLHVTRSVARANAFYRRLGFAPTGESFRMPRKPALELVTMRRDLV